MKMIIITGLIFLQSIFSQEIFPIEISLVGEAKDKSLEMSGLAWYEDYLILMPQYVKKEDSFFYYLTKKDIIKWIESDQKNSLEPDKIKLQLPNFGKQIEGFQGFEAITFYGKKAYMVIESKNSGVMKSFLVKGKLDFKNRKLVVDSKGAQEIPIPVNIKNMGFESILKYKSRLMVLYEANGKNVNKNPSALLYNSSLEPKGFISFPNLEYRLTDITSLDSKNKFWVLNYFWPGEKDRLNPAKDSILKDVKEGKTHNKYEHVERLVEYEISGDKVVRTSTPPIQLSLEKKSRNWEGLARLDDKGFIIIVDEHPRTILAFIPKS